MFNSENKIGYLFNLCSIGFGAVMVLMAFLDKLNVI